MEDNREENTNQPNPLLEIHGGASSYKARIKNLGTDIRIPVLSEPQIADLAGEQPFSTHVAAYEMAMSLGTFEEDPDPDSGFIGEPIDLNDDELLEEEFSEGDFRALAYMSLLDGMLAAIPRFERIILMMAELDGDKAALTVREIYEAFIRVNPKADPTYYCVLQASGELEPELERAMSMLPTQSVSPLWLENPMYSSNSEVVLRSVTFEAAIGEAVSEEAPIEAPVVMTKTEELAIDAEKVLGLSANLKAVVVGQELAIEHVSSVAKRMAVGFRDESRPAAVFVFAGPTGVGKTLLAKQMALQLFGNDKIGRIDCAMLSDSHHSNKLFGAPPGYVGYPDTRKSSAKEADPSLIYTETKGMASGGVLLLDEVEKAHPDIWDGFLTILDEGYAKTSVGNIVDFRNMVIIMTTNLGSREFASSKGRVSLGFANTIDAPELPIDSIRKTAMSGLEEYMKPEVIGRITEVVPFRDLTEAELVEIVDLEWAKTSGFITRKSSATIDLSDELKFKIAKKSSGRGYGARLVSRLLDLYAVDPLAEFYLSGGKASFDDPEAEILVTLNLDEDKVMVCHGSNSCTYDIKESSLVA
jgi:DNA polymerase III delta prime subunit